jgi:pimeloyl-ACP methyl ester carboxylesterase
MIPYKEYGNSSLTLLENHNNDSIIIMMPGQALPPEAFFNLPIYEDGQSIADHIVSSGCNVAFFDPIGYGASVGNSEGGYNGLESAIGEIPWYNREVMAEQIVAAIKFLKQKYNTVFLESFCTTTAAVFVAATLEAVDGIVAVTPHRFKSTNKSITSSSINKVRYESVQTMSDVRIREWTDVVVTTCLGHNVRVPHWGQMLKDKISTYSYTESGAEWISPQDIAIDVNLYVNVKGNNGWNAADLGCPIAVIGGEYDTESFDPSSVEEFKASALNGNIDLSLIAYHEKVVNFYDEVAPNLIKNTIIKQSTHFGMWDSSFKEYTTAFINSIDALKEANASSSSLDKELALEV